MTPYSNTTAVLLTRTGLAIASLGLAAVPLIAPPRDPRAGDTCLSRTFHDDDNTRTPSRAH